MKTKIHFYKWQSLLSAFIRWRTSSQHTHTSIELGEWVYEALQQWVVKSKNPSFYNWWIEYCTIEIDISEKQYEIWKKFLEEQVWKKYDKIWIMWIFFLDFYQNPNKWFCSELAFEFLKKIWYINNIDNIWVTPWRLYFWLNLLQNSK